MKKVFLLMVVAVFGMTTANAQLYLGGSLGFESEKEKEAESKTTTFTIAPEVGYSVSDKLDVGISLGILNSKLEKSFYEFQGMNAFFDEVKLSGWEVAPYVRYNMVQFGNFSVLAKASIAFGGGKATVKIAGQEQEGKLSIIGVNIAPVLKYTLSDKFDLLANLNFMSVGFNQQKVKDGETTTNFGLNVDSNDVANLNGGEVPFTIGFAYKF
jgi:long-subunit fatty acid transport protein